LRPELQLEEIFFSPHSLLQNQPTFSVGFVLTSGAATKHKYLERTLRQTN